MTVVHRSGRWLLGPTVAATVLLAGCATQPAPAQPAAGPRPATQPPADRPPDLARCPASGPARAGGLPDVVLDCLGPGPAVRLAGLQGRPTVVNVWAQWCGPCRDEVPLLQDLHERADGRLRVLGVDYADTPDGALAFAAQVGMTYPSVADPDGLIKAPLRITGLPQTFFVDAEGRVVARHVGEITSAGQLAGLVRRHLGVTA